MAADCEVRVATRRCGVIAVGRCASCGSAFCSSHRALSGRGQVIINQCGPCAQAVSNDAHDFERQRQVARELPALTERGKYLANVLKAHRVRPLTARKFVTDKPKRLFRAAETHTEETQYWQTPFDWSMPDNNDRRDWSKSTPDMRLALKVNGEWAVYSDPDDITTIEDVSKSPFAGSIAGYWERILTKNGVPTPKSES